MPSVHIRDVSESTLAALRERATMRGHSMQRELRRILDAAAAEPLPSEVLPPLRLVTVNTNSAMTWRREEIYGDEGR